MIETSLASVSFGWLWAGLFLLLLVITGITSLFGFLEVITSSLVSLPPLLLPHHRRHHCLSWHQSAYKGRDWHGQAEARPLDHLPPFRDLLLPPPCSPLCLPRLPASPPRTPAFVHSHSFPTGLGCLPWMVSLSSPRLQCPTGR